MNRKDIRAAVGLYLAGVVSENDAEGLARWNLAIDMAYLQVAAECPQALIPVTLRVETPEAVSSKSAAASGVSVATTADAYVMEFTGGTYQGPTDGTGDGIFQIDLTPAGKGRVFRHQIREFWTTGGHRYFSLDRPWGQGTATIGTWELRVPWLWLPENISSVQGIMTYGSDGQVLRTVSTAEAMLRGQWKNAAFKGGSVPNSVRREHHYQQPAPNRSPTVATTDGSWGDEPYGAFEYCYTYCWGYRSKNLLTQGGYSVPLFESSPSPISAGVASTATKVIQVTTPEIDWQVNFNVAGTLRAGHSGIYKRIYRRRKTVVGGLHTTIEYPYVFQTLADIDGTTTVYTDNGSVIPDYSGRLPEVQGYYAWGLYPETQAAREYEVLGTVRPSKLMHDQDAPRIAPECMQALVAYAAAILARHDKDPVHAQTLERKGADILRGYRNAYENPTGIVRRRSMFGDMQESVVVHGRIDS